MVPGEPRRFLRRSTIPFHLVGRVVVLGAVAHFLCDGDSLVSDGGETLVLLALSVTFFYAGLRVATEDLSVSQIRRVLAITVGFATVGVAVTGFLVLVRFAEGEPLGEEAYVVFLGATAAGAVGSPVGYYSLQLEASRDELEERYREVETLNKRLRVADRVLRHNLRNDLNVIEGAASTLSTEVDIEEGERWLDVLDSHTDRLLSTCDQVNELQQVWRQDAREPIDLVDTVDSAVETIREGYDVDIEVVVDDAGPVPMRAHPKLEAAIREAMDNAARHNESPVSIRVTIDPEEGPEDHARLRIADDGSGIPDIEIEPLETGPETQLEHGSGVGLWLIYGVAQKSDASLNIRDRDPEGTAVVFDLPLANGAERPERTESVPELFPA